MSITPVFQLKVKYLLNFTVEGVIDFYIVIYNIIYIPISLYLTSETFNNSLIHAKFSLTRRMEFL